MTSLAGTGRRPSLKMKGLVDPSAPVPPECSLFTYGTLQAGTTISCSLAVAADEIRSPTTGADTPPLGFSTGASLKVQPFDYAPVWHDAQRLVYITIVERKWGNGGKEESVRGGE